MYVQEETIPCLDKKTTFKQKSDQMRKYRPSIIMTWNPAVYITNARICLSITWPVTTRSSFFYLSGPFLGPANHSKRIWMLLWCQFKFVFVSFLPFVVKLGIQILDEQTCKLCQYILYFWKWKKHSLFSWHCHGDGDYLKLGSAWWGGDLVDVLHHTIG